MRAIVLEAIRAHPELLMLASKCPAPAPTAVQEAASASPEPAAVQPNALAVAVPAALDTPPAVDAAPASQKLAPVARASKYRWSPTTTQPASPVVPARADSKTAAVAPVPAPPRRQVVRVHQVSRHYEYRVEHIYERDEESPRR